MLVMIGLNILISQQWIRNERLSYPIIQLPLAITEDGGQLTFSRGTTFTHSNHRNWTIIYRRSMASDRIDTHLLFSFCHWVSLFYAA